jgi:uncharacterized protein YydD (DUF2326 family)
MIREIWSPSRATFKRLRFKPGLNIVSVRRTDKATATGKRNAAGKSSLIDVVHFLFGGNKEAGSPLSATELSTDEFKMTCDIGGVTLAVSRAMDRSSYLSVEGDVRPLARQPEIDKTTGDVRFSTDAWCDSLGQTMFGLPPADRIGAGEFLSFRACFSYFARRQRTGGYLDWRRFFVQQRPVSWQVVLAALFELDREGSLALYRVKEADRQKAQLEKLLKGEFAAVAMPSAARLRINSRKTRRQLSRLESQLAGYRVIDFYDDLVEEANMLQASVDQLTNANVLDDELVRDIVIALRNEKAPSFPELADLYRQAGVVLQDAVLKRYEEVEDFHKAVVSNRQQHLEVELADTRARIEVRRKEIAEKSAKRNDLLETLDSGGALQQYRKLDNQLAHIRSENATIERQLELAEKLEVMRSDLKVQRAEAERRIKQDLVERRPIIDRAAEVFEEISQRLYDTPAQFDIIGNKDGLDFKIDAPEIASDGIKQVQIFTFDLTLASLAASRGRWPGFLIHDSHIFDGVDGRQIALALLAANDKMKELGGQYIVTMNSDDLEKAEREGKVSFKNYIVEPELDDSPSGCLFGFRFATDDDPINRTPATDGDPPG